LDKLIIIFAFLLTLYLFFSLIKIRLKKDEKSHHTIYVLITIIISLIAIWGIFRNF